uniref:Uncharacterized protein n=1 Tax=Oryza meridionalis TaxID=40149 RepID=A0A0E0DZQ1_9ORYZ
MSLCCSSSSSAAAAARRFLLPHLFLGRRSRRHDQVRYTVLHHPRTHTTAAAPAATASTPRLSPSQQRQVSLYVDALLDWNQRMNLTAVTDEDEVMTRHVADSLAVLPPLERAYRGDLGGMRLVDVGSGAGLPGLILAVARPSWKFLLLESMQKRCLFLEHAVEVMGLSNVDVVFESMGPHGQRTAVVYIKERVTPKKYPRHPGTPSKMPL